MWIKPKAIAARVGEKPRITAGGDPSHSRDPRLGCCSSASLSALPNAVLTVVVAGLATASIAVGPTAGSRTAQVITLGLMAATTLWFLSSTSALFALSTGAGSLVGALQAFLLRREGSVVVAIRT